MEKNNIFTESGLQFTFPDKSKVIKFDDTKFYRGCFDRFPGAKGVDFIFLERDKIAFIEVKNCTGNESENRWRISPNNDKKEKVHTSIDVSRRDSLDIEVTQKTAMTLAALTGAGSFSDGTALKKELDVFIKFLLSDAFSDTSMMKYVILVLEGDFGSKSRSKKMIMQALQENIKRKLKWLNCNISVVDSETCNKRLFSIEHIEDKDKN